MGDKLKVGGEALRRIHYQANKRKTEIYWLGFLQGARASGRVEHAEIAAIKAEAENFQKFFNDPDARDLVEDITHVHGIFDHDLYEQLGDIVDIRMKLAAADDGFSNKDRINEFLGFCAGVICDGEVLAQEARAIVRRFSKDPALNEHPHLARLSETLSEAMADGILTGSEAEDVKRWIVRIVGDGYADTGVPSLGNTSALPDQLEDHRAIIFPDRIFVVTGALRIAPRRKLAAMVKNKGGIFAERITLETNYLVVAPSASRDWKSTHFGAKIETAQKYIASGSPLRFVPEHIFEQALGLARF